MGRADRRHVAGLDTHVVARGSYGAVRLSDEAKKVFDALAASPDEMRMAETASLRRYFDRFADKGTTSFDNTMFKSLGRFKDGTGKKAQVFEFKAYQFRMYGVLRGCLETRFRGGVDGRVQM